MEQAEFQTQVKRLQNQFGQTAYSTERCKVVWEEVKNLSAAQFARIVDRCLGEFRQPPLLPELREMISKERERAAQARKQTHAQDSADFWSSKFHTDEQRQMFEMTQKRILGQVSDADWDQFVKQIDQVSKGGAA